ncbi:MAG: hypothetical protein KGH64_02225 [Candidatus Micrarchaeota archaeon]|nr:hypothetical protein [Candidatus Micrarchaeota archaeon]MDE1834133.1 hypothetical protein [Candidatus Micrarchaeota archaeon]MDE1859229.1 hypothetical protein [Candidatus Micrarchaeota archaeon]
MEADLGKGMGDAGLKAFEKKVAGSDNCEYTVENAERKDLVYLVENSCLSCNKLMGKSEVKVIPPRYIQERDYYVSSGAVSKRLMCVSCYNALKTVTRTKVKIRHGQSLTTRRNFLMKTVINNLLLK